MGIINRKQIVEKLKERLELLNFIYALWLEGADASGMVDEYSDVDFWVNFEDEYKNEAQTQFPKSTVLWQRYLRLKSRVWIPIQIIRPSFSV